MASRKNKNQEQGSLFAPSELLATQSSRAENRWDAPQYEFDERAFKEKHPQAKKFKPRREHLKTIQQRIQDQEDRKPVWAAIHAKLKKDMGIA
jgi:hypothetical protein